MGFLVGKIERLQEMAKEPSQRSLPTFSPPKPTLYSGLLTSFKIERELFAKLSFQEAIRRTFVAAGQAPMPGLQMTVYQQYLSHSRNSISRHLLPEGKPEETAGSLATICQGEVDAATCNDSDEPETDDDVELEDEE